MRNIALIEQELLRIDELPSWNRKQGNDWDRLSDFIYSVETIADLEQEIRRVAQTQAITELDSFTAYVLRRWYNFWTHEVVLDMFLAYPEVKSSSDKKHREIDFYIDETPIDLKLSEFPRAYSYGLQHALRSPLHLIQWLYENQSTEQRYHLANRLFIVCHDIKNPSKSWRVKRMFELIRSRVDSFMQNPQFYSLSLRHQSGKTVHPLANVIFCLYETE